MPSGRKVMLQAWYSPGLGMQVNCKQHARFSRTPSCWVHAKHIVSPGLARSTRHRVALPPVADSGCMPQSASHNPLVMTTLAATAWKLLYDLTANICSVALPPEGATCAGQPSQQWTQQWTCCPRGHIPTQQAAGLTLGQACLAPCGGAQDGGAAGAGDDRL